MPNFQTQSGQIGLITLLIMTVMLSVGVSVANRSTQDLRITRQEEDASKVFNATEAGIEEALADLNVGAGSVNIDPTVSVDFVTDQLNFLETTVTQGNSVTLDTSTVLDGRRIVFEWGKNEDCSTNVGDIVVTIYNSASDTVTREGFTGCDRGTGFIVVTNPGADGYFRRRVLILLDGDTMIRVRAVSNDVSLKVRAAQGVVPWPDFPVQQYQVTSTGRDLDSDETKVVQVTRTLPGTPSIFDYVLFSGSTIVK